MIINIQQYFFFLIFKIYNELKSNLKIIYLETLSIPRILQIYNKLIDTIYEINIAIIITSMILIASRLLFYILYL